MPTQNPGLLARKVGAGIQEDGSVPTGTKMLFMEQEVSHLQLMEQAALVLAEGASWWLPERLEGRTNQSVTREVRLTLVQAARQLPVYLEVRLPVQAAGWWLVRAEGRLPARVVRWWPGLAMRQKTVRVEVRWLVRRRTVLGGRSMAAHLVRHWGERIGLPSVLAPRCRVN